MRKNETRSLCAALGLLATITPTWASASTALLVYKDEKTKELKSVEVDNIDATGAFYYDDNGAIKAELQEKASVVKNQNFASCLKNSHQAVFNTYRSTKVVAITTGSYVVFVVVMGRIISRNSIGFAKSLVKDIPKVEAAATLGAAATTGTTYAIENTVTAHSAAEFANQHAKGLAENGATLVYLSNDGSTPLKQNANFIQKVQQCFQQ